MDEAILCDKVTILSNGEILAVDTPYNILQLGKTKLKIMFNGEEKIDIINSTSEDLANELKKFGLNKNVSSVELQSDNIDQIILSILKEKEREVQ